MATSKDAALASVDLFGGLNKRQLSRLAKTADMVSVDPGRVLVEEGRRGRELLVIVDGAAEVSRSGHKIASLGPGDSIGEMSLLDHEPASATVVATEPCDLVVIEGQRFGPLLSDTPGLAENLLATLSSRLREADKAFDV